MRRVESFGFDLTCGQCHSHFEINLVREPIQVLCPNGHFMGTWNYAGTEERKCKVCGGKVIGIFHIRIRHDILSPKGQQLRVAGTSQETKAVFDHLMSHPEILKLCVKAGLVKVEPHLAKGMGQEE